MKQTIPEALTDIQRAARFYYLQKSCFGGKREGRTFGSKTLASPGSNPIPRKEDLSAAHLRLANAFIERLDWAACIDRTRSRITRRRGTVCRSLSLSMKRWQSDCGVSRGDAIVSLNDHPDIRRVFDGFYIETAPIQYTVGVEAVDRNELIIFSWDDAAQPVGLF